MPLSISQTYKTSTWWQRTATGFLGYYFYFNTIHVNVAKFNSGKVKLKTVLVSSCPLPLLRGGLQALCRGFAWLAFAFVCLLAPLKGQLLAWFPRFFLCILMSASRQTNKFLLILCKPLFPQVSILHLIWVHWLRWIQSVPWHFQLHFQQLLQTWIF